ncbi:MAG: flippase [Ktedonobacteraceae bacterium]|nr:flippase [Ktedonobacteraceae bacterium]
MNSLRRVVNNTVISLAGQAITWASTLLLTIAYGRFLGDIKFGELYFAITFVALIGFPLEFGFNQQLTRDVAQEPHKALRYLLNTLLIKTALWLFLYGLILLACWLLEYSMEQRIIVAICGFTLLSTAIANTFAALYYALQRVVFPVIGTILEKGISALTGILLLKYGAGIQVMACVLLGSSIIGALWQAICFFRLVQTKEGFILDTLLMRQLLRTGIPFLVYGVLGVIYYRLDTVLLSLMTNVAVVGWYGAGYRLFDTLVFLPNIVITAIMYPVFSKLSITSNEQLKLAIEKSMNFLLLCGIPTATFMIAAAPNIIGFLYHRPEFTNTFPVLQALAPGLVFLYINTVFSTILISTRQEKKITIMAAVALVFNLGLNLFLIPLYKHVGAAIVTSLTELLLSTIALLLVPRALVPWASGRVAVKALLASAAMTVVVLLLRSFSIFAILAVAIVVYLGAATLLRTIPGEDLKALYRAIRYRKRQTLPSADLPEMEVALEEEWLGDAEGITEKRSITKWPELPTTDRPVHEISPEWIDEVGPATEKHPIQKVKNI